MIAIDWRRKKLENFRVSHVPSGSVRIVLSRSIYSHPLYRTKDDLLEAFMRALQIAGRKIQFSSGHMGAPPSIYVDWAY